MLSNAYFLAKFRFDTAENEPAKNLQNFAKFANFADPNPDPNPLRDAERPHFLEHAGLPSPRHGNASEYLASFATSAAVTTADRQIFGKMLLVFGCIGTDLCK